MCRVLPLPTEGNHLIDKALFRRLAADQSSDNSAYVRAVRQLRQQAEFAELALGGPVEIDRTELEIDEEKYLVHVTFKRKR